MLNFLVEKDLETRQIPGSRDLTHLSGDLVHRQTIFISLSFVFRLFSLENIKTDSQFGSEARSYNGSEEVPDYQLEIELLSGRVAVDFISKACHVSPVATSYIFQLSSNLYVKPAEKFSQAIALQLKFLLLVDRTGLSRSGQNEPDQMKCATSRGTFKFKGVQ